MPSEADPTTPVSSEVALAARVAACEEAEATKLALDAKLTVMKAFLESSSKRLEARLADEASLRARGDELSVQEDTVTRTVSTLQEAIDACEQRLGLTKQLLHEGGLKLEALRARGGVAEEVHRDKTIQLGVLGERCLERNQQLKQITLHCLEQRLRVGLDAWRPTQRRAEALEAWCVVASKRRRHKERLQGCALLWRASALHRAMTRWTATTTSGTKSAGGGMPALLS